MPKAKRAASKKKSSVSKSKKRPIKPRKPQKRTSAQKKKSSSSAPILPWRKALRGEKWVGVVDDYFSHIGVITLTLKTPLKLNDQIHVRGHTTDMTQTVDSLQIDRTPVPEAGVGDGVGIKIKNKCRRGDYVYTIKSVG